MLLYLVTYIVYLVAIRLDKSVFLSTYYQELINSQKEKRACNFVSS